MEARHCRDASAPGSVRLSNSTQRLLGLPMVMQACAVRLPWSNSHCKSRFCERLDVVSCIVQSCGPGPRPLASVVGLLKAQLCSQLAWVGFLIPAVCLTLLLVLWLPAVRSCRAVHGAVKHGCCNHLGGQQVG